MALEFILVGVMNAQSQQSSIYPISYKIQVPVVRLPKGVKIEQDYVTLPFAFPDHTSAVKQAEQDFKGYKYAVVMSHDKPMVREVNGIIYHPVTGQEVPKHNQQFEQWALQQGIPLAGSGPVRQSAGLTEGGGSTTSNTSTGQ